MAAIREKGSRAMACAGPAQRMTYRLAHMAHAFAKSFNIRQLKLHIVICDTSEALVTT